MAQATIPPGSPDEGPGKGKTFFEYAKVAADTSNFDYAIDMYIEGLNREPCNVAEHEKLYNVSLTRKVKGGKPAGGLMGPKLPYKGKTPKDQMLNAEWLLSKDPGHIPSMMTIMRTAKTADYPEVVKFMGPIVLHANRTSKTPKKDIYIEIATIYEEVKDFRKASEAVMAAQQMDPDDMELDSWLKNLAANETIGKGKYGEAEKDWKESIKDIEQTNELLQQENLVKSLDFKHSQIEKTRADYERNPTELQVITKYVKALIATEEDAYENIAIDVLHRAHTQTQTYRYKFQLGEIKIIQLKRKVRGLIEAYKANPGAKDKEAELKKALEEQIAFEVTEYKERTDNFPTDMHILFEYGSRLFKIRRYEDAISALQVAQNSPKYRPDALHYLGLSFMHQGMKPEAMETLKRAVDEYEFSEMGDRKSKDFHYDLARAYEENGRAPEAMQIYSKIAQWDINFKDVRVRLAALRQQVAGPART